MTLKTCFNPQIIHLGLSGIFYIKPKKLIKLGYLNFYPTKKDTFFNSAKS